MTKDTLRDEIEKIQLDLVEKTANPTTKWEDVIPEATNQILSLLEEAVGEEWHHNSATWCAGANTRRKDILNKINPEKGQSNETK